jgi:hypothetical protein
VFGFNPLERATEYFAGDWQAVAKAGKALGHAGEAFDDLAYNTQGGAITLHRRWQGMAAGAAYDQFTDLASTVESTVGPLQEISKQFDTIAHGVWSACEAVDGWLKGLLDAAIIAGVAAAAGTLLSWTGVGAVSGYSVAALEVCEMLDNWAEATREMSNLYTLVQIAVGVIESQLAVLHSTQLPDASAFNAYHSPF